MDTVVEVGYALEKVLSKCSNVLEYSGTKFIYDEETKLMVDLYGNFESKLDKVIKRLNLTISFITEDKSVREEICTYIEEELDNHIDVVTYHVADYLEEYDYITYTIREY